MQTLVSKLFVESRQCGNLHVRFRTSSTTTPLLSITYPIDEVDEPLGFPAPEAPCHGDAVLGMHDDRRGLYHGNTRHVGTIVE